MEKKEENQNSDNARGIDPRVSGPLDLRLLSADQKSFSASSHNPPSEAVKESDRIHLVELVEQFAKQIDLPDLKMDGHNCCSFSIGEEHEGLVITLELRSGGKLLLFTPLQRYPEGISKELESRIEMIGSEQGDENYYLSNSEHSVFLCASYSISEANLSLFADWILDFYKRALEWRGRYGKETSPDSSSSAPLRIPPSSGLKV